MSDMTLGDAGWSAPRPRGPEGSSGATRGSVARRIDALIRMLRPTPIVPIPCEGIRLFAKLEGQNPVGSVKDRPALWVLKRAAERGDIGDATTVVESSSGNFAMALASYARLLGMKFIPVIDPNINPLYESSLRQLSTTVVRVTERDAAGGYLQTRLGKVRELCATLKDAYWTNQYSNRDAAEAHYVFTGREIADGVSGLDFVFVGVSTGGTIAGVSRRVKERFPAARVVAVDAEGSVIFGGPAKKRHIPGIGATIRPALVDEALIDDVVTVPEQATIRACHELVRDHGLFVGGSSGTCYAAIKKCLPSIRSARAAPSVLFICADRGAAYLDTVFDRTWSARVS